MNEKISRLVARWLAHPTGIFQALGTTALWFATPPVFHWSWHAAVFWYLGYCTFISFATQFTLAYQNNKAQVALDLSLRNMTDMMRLDIALAKKVEESLSNLDTGVDKLITLATTEEEIREAFLEQDEGLAAVIASMQKVQEARRKLSMPLNKLLPEDTART